jgi:hypothetical protein
VRDSVVATVRAQDARTFGQFGGRTAITRLGKHGETAQMANQFDDEGGEFGGESDDAFENGFHLESESLDDDAGEGELLETDGALALKADPEPQLTREQRRSRRKRDVRARTISVKRLSKAELERGRLLFPEDTASERPKMRADCGEGARPCPFVSCQHHLYLDVSPRTGAIKLNFPDLEVWEMTETCALDVADRGGTTLEEVGAIMNLTRERIRQVEVKGLAKLQAYEEMTALRDYVDEGPIGKRKLPIISTRELDKELADEKARFDLENDDEDEADAF